ncbi:MAG: hypothetical protein A2Z18_02235 [Armatimonadetes bacterium RBG_16_58_9]|nr:MAG: hypothetical protein A2Z18_02235 [Armatimonadetes bacterium RBG_16_58_9]
MIRSSIEVLDRHYAEALGCTVEDLNSGKLIVVGNDMHKIDFAKDVPLALFAFTRRSGGVVSVKPCLVGEVERAMAGASELDDPTCVAVRHAVSGLVEAEVWFLGARLCCDPGSFVDKTAGTIREVTREDAYASRLHGKWGGPVFGCIEDGLVVSWAAVNPLSDIVWDISVETLPEYRGRGCAKSAVSAALQFIFDNGKLAAWGCDRTNAASLATARSLGFQDYALEFGCVEKTAGQ